jgi:hypothetical protein
LVKEGYLGSLKARSYKNTARGGHAVRKGPHSKLCQGLVISVDALVMFRRMSGYYFKTDLGSLEQRNSI